VRTSSSMRSASRSSRAVPEWIERKTDEQNVVTPLFWTTRTRPRLLEDVHARADTAIDIDLVPVADCGDHGRKRGSARAGSVELAYAMVRHQHASAPAFTAITASAGSRMPLLRRGVEPAAGCPTLSARLQLA